MGPAQRCHLDGLTGAARRVAGPARSQQRPDWGVCAKTALAGPAAVLRLPVALHLPRRHRQRTAGGHPRRSGDSSGAGRRSRRQALHCHARRAVHRAAAANAGGQPPRRVRTRKPSHDRRDDRRDASSGRQVHGCACCVLRAKTIAPMGPGAAPNQSPDRALPTPPSQWRPPFRACHPPNPKPPLLAAAPDLTLPLQRLVRRFSSTRFVRRWHHCALYQRRPGV